MGLPSENIVLIGDSIINHVDPSRVKDSCAAKVKSLEKAMAYTIQEVAKVANEQTSSPCWGWLVILGLERRPNFECFCNGQKIIVFYFCLPFQVLNSRFCPSAKHFITQTWECCFCSL